MTNVVVDEERITNKLIEEIKPLIKAHWKEIAHNKDKIKLNPDFNWYKENDAAGTLHTVTARIDGELAGYFITVVSKHPHYKDHLFGINDILFVHPKYRKTNMAVGLFMYAEKKLKEKGVSVLSIHMKTDHPFEGFAERLGYNKAEYNYTKYLGE